VRQPIVVVLGHVDHGKTLLLDYIRRSRVQAKEAGGITQHIGATEVPGEYIKKFCKPMLEKMGVKIEIPGLLFIDTPGHAAFSNLRKRGGSVADLAVLVIDINAGVMPQTVESVEILKQFRVPFVIAANKLDLVPGYRSREGSFLENVRKQDPKAIGELEQRIYTIVGKLAELGFESERIDRVEDFTKQVAIVPTSAVTGEGVVDLLAVLAGLAQKYLKERLETTGRLRGNVLEVKQERGLGTTVDAIIYDGVLREGDTIVLAGKEGPIVTRVRCLLKPEPLAEIRAEKKFRRVERVEAASGVKIAAPNLENAVPGGSIFKVEEGEDLADIILLVKKEIEEIEFSTDEVGVVVKADTLGTLEALVKMLQQRGIKVRKAGIGDVTKSDIVEAEESRQRDPFLGVVFAFNVKTIDEEFARAKGVKIIEGNIIYKLIEDYEKWVEEEKRRLREEELGKLPRPAKFQIIPGYVFRASKPAIVGVEVIGGVLKNHVIVMRSDGKEVGEIKELQVQGQPVKEAGRGAKVAVSIEGPTVGRQIKEGDILYTSMSEREYRRLLNFLDLLGEDEKKVLEEIVAIKRREKKTWGMLEME